MDESPYIRHHYHCRRCYADRAWADRNAGAAVRRIGSHLMARAALFWGAGARRCSDACIDIWISENYETSAQKHSGSRRHPSGLSAGAVGKPAHSENFCKGAADCSAGGKPDGKAQGRTDEAQ